MNHDDIPPAMLAGADQELALADQRLRRMIAGLVDDRYRNGLQDRTPAIGVLAFTLATTCHPQELAVMLAVALDTLATNEMDH